MELGVYRNNLKTFGTLTHPTVNEPSIMYMVDGYSHLKGALILKDSVPRMPDSDTPLKLQTYARLACIF